MERHNQKRVYIISGPAGVGKSTVAQALAEQLTHSAYISGQQILQMHSKGLKGLRKRKQDSVLLWYNILSLTKNFLMFNIDTVIDFVTLPNEAMWLKKQLKNEFVEISYIVLWADKQTIIDRDKNRKYEQQLGEKCLLSYNLFSEASINKNHLLDTTMYSKNEISLLISDIMTSRLYLLD